MTELIVDDKAIAFIKAELERANSPAARLFVTGGGCSQHLDIAAVEKEVARDIKHVKDGVTFHVEKYLDDNTFSLEITFDEKREVLSATINYKSCN